MRMAQRAMRAAATKGTAANELEAISQTEAILRAIERATRLVGRSQLRLMNLEREDLVQEAAVIVIRKRSRLHLFDSANMPSHRWFVYVVRNVVRTHLRRQPRHEELFRDIYEDGTGPADNSPLPTQTFQQLRHSISPPRARFLERAKRSRNKVRARPVKTATFGVTVLSSMAGADEPTALCVAS